jgi:glycosyltransferase involved in cell wall biosynthesis
VIIPVFNGAALLADAVRSVRDQRLGGIEIVVVDDGSTDGTAGVVAALGHDLRYLRQDNRGPAAARNLGLQAARAPLIAFLDQDDLWPPDHLAILTRALDGDPAAAVAMGLTQAHLLVRRTAAGPVFEPHSRPWRAPHIGSALFRRTVFDTVGRFDAELARCSDDLDWFMRARERQTRMVLVNEVTYVLRIHEANTQRDRDFRRQALLEAVGQSVRRRRHPTPDA